MTESNNKTSEGTVLEIIRMSTEDGPGIRTTVFLKGCTLKCSWCHNPESISIKPQVQWIDSNCIGCHICIDTCPQKALAITTGGITINRELCLGCGKCSEACPSTAMEILGTRWKSHELIEELVKDRAYFEKSGGGVTLSGGEASMQVDFSLEVLRGLRERGIDTALDTCGFIAIESLEKLMPYSDLVLFDIKEIDPEKHRLFTGAANDKILENIIRVSDFIREHVSPQKLWIRTPIIPGATATHENIEGIGRFISENLGNTVDRWELCSFNNLCKDKYLRLGLDWEFRESEQLTKEFMEALTDTAKSTGVDPSIISWSGSTKIEENTPDSENSKNYKINYNSKKLPSC